jgi:hypothetical protein
MRRNRPATLGFTGPSSRRSPSRLPCSAIHRRLYRLDQRCAPQPSPRAAEAIATAIAGFLAQPASMPTAESLVGTSYPLQRGSTLSRRAAALGFRENNYAGRILGTVCDPGSSVTLGSASHPWVQLPWAKLITVRQNGRQSPVKFRGDASRRTKAHQMVGFRAHPLWMSWWRGVPPSLRLWTPLLQKRWQGGRAYAADEQVAYSVATRCREGPRNWDHTANLPNFGFDAKEPDRQELLLCALSVPPLMTAPHHSITRNQNSR